jgi:hypothetical protein
MKGKRQMSNTVNDDTLETYFAAARVCASLPSDDLMDRVHKDAIHYQKSFKQKSIFQKLKDLTLPSFPSFGYPLVMAGLAGCLVMAGLAGCLVMVPNFLLTPETVIDANTYSVYLEVSGNILFDSILSDAELEI